MWLLINTLCERVEEVCYYSRQGKPELLAKNIHDSINLSSLTGLCRHLKFNTPLQGFVLEGHMIKNLSIGIDASCKNLCTLESHCVSFNLGPPVKDRMVCELSNSDDTLHPEHLIPREGFVYRGTQVGITVTIIGN